ncbi:cadherin-23-like [Gigantopelta aegis]|uniref:cadherin-23-like n=1 Tax=Gigantopelta aegis TaxID=1735272 RepID=UPI001B88E4A3|nr:cadherin-23-like [Gigantopelta aegis]
MRSQLRIFGSLTLLGLWIQVTSAANSAPYFMTRFQNGTKVDGTLNQRLTRDGLSEDLTKGSEIGYVICGDNDNDPITYKIESNSLSINSLSGLVTLQVALDREGDITNTSLVKPKFICEDGRGLSATADIDITIKDVNDNRPTFLNEPYKANVPEDLPVGSTLSTSEIIVVDPDELFNAIVNFRCLGTPVACSTFQLQSIMLDQGRYKLNLILVKPLNYEDIKSYTYSIFAEDQGEKIKLSTTKNVGIEVKDRQDTLPIILNTPIALTVDENIAVGTELQVKIMAQDGDTGDAREIKIVILSDSDPKKLFRIGRAVRMSPDLPTYAAPVFVNKVIDREANSGRYEFRIQAIELDNGNETLDRTTATVTVDILDKNDNIPTFSSPSYTVNLTEQDTLQNKGNTQVPDLNIQVTDADDASNAKYTLAIERQTYPAFRVSPEQEILGNTAVQLIIVNTSYLDYDTPMYRRQELVLIAKESQRTDGKTPLTSTATVTINLIDLNDNSPIFSGVSFSKSLPENTKVGSTIIRLTATDKDEGSNGQIHYSVRGTEDSVFKVNPTTGVVTLNQPLDYEKQTEHRIQYLATDMGQPPRTTEVAFTLNVQNINDVGPEFDKEIYRTFAFETSFELRPTIQVKATDPEGATITYRIQSGNSPNSAFVLDSVNGKLSLQQLLDYDQTENKGGLITLIIEANDNGSPPMTSTASVIITVQNENNHSPQFSQTSYSQLISEIAKPGTYVLKINASDADTGLNGKILYSIASGGDENFDLNMNTGVLTISNKVSFDYDVVKKYDLKVYATDQGTQPRTATSKVEITISDANNKVPVFESLNYHRNIEETKPIGTSILFVIATDADGDHQLEYSILTKTVQARNSGGSFIHSISLFDYRKAFKIDKTSGLIKTAMNLSRDLTAEIQFAVQVQDVKSATGMQTATTSVNIIILASNVSTIVFDPPWTKLRPIHQFMVPEGIRGEPITTLIARDPVCACTLRDYQIIPGSARPENVFRVNRITGTVTIVENKDLDYESNTRIFTVQVVATSVDRRTAVTTIRVEISDINDNPPQFEESKYSFNLLETYAYPSVVGYITARDDDSGNFGRVEYILSGSGSKDFKIFNQQGLLIVNQGVDLDYETKRRYHLLVSARDNPGNNSQSAVYHVTTVPVEINILDFNDNSPEFTGDPYAITVVETAAIGTSVGKIQATDKDSGINAEIVYSLDDGRNLFRIIPTTGVILTRRSLSGLSESFKLSVTATDRGYPPKMNTTSVDINIKSGQLDDGTPDWKVPRRGEVAYVLEGLIPPQPVLKVKATAKSTNAKAMYSFLTTINNDHMKFKIDRESGTITTNFIFDREDKDKYELILMATDSTNTSIVSYRNLVVLVNDTNDNAPTFDSCALKVPNPLHVNLRENSPVDTSVYQVKACDPDIYVNQVDYFPYKTSPDCRREWAKQNFYLSSTHKGLIVTKKRLDREQQKSYLVCVEAKAAGRRRRSVFNETEMKQRNVVAYIIVNLLDENDNRPVFPNRVILLGIESMPQILQQVVRVTAHDNDLTPYDRTLYDIVNIEYYDPDPDQPTYSIRGAFRINRDNGIIMTNLPSYTDYMQAGSYFALQVIATDFNNPKLNDTMSVLLFVYEPTQSLRVVLNEKPSEQAQQKANELIKKLSSADSTSVFQLKKVTHHRIGESYELNKTDVCFIVIREYRVMNVYAGVSYLKKNNKIFQILKDFGDSKPGACIPKKTSMDSINWSSLWWVLVAVAIFIFVCCLILIIAIIILFNNYKNFMRTRKTDLIAQDLDQW